jgi:hypothetical protein
MAWAEMEQHPKRLDGLGQSCDMTVPGWLEGRKQRCDSTRSGSMAGGRGVTQCLGGSMAR